MMKKIIALFMTLSICLLLLPAFALASADKPSMAITDNHWLNYEKEAKVAGRKVCDNGETNATVYEHEKYLLYVAVTASGGTYLYLLTVKGGKYFVKFGDKAVEVSHETWDSALKLASPNWYAIGRGENDDCRVVN